MAGKAQLDPGNGGRRGGISFGALAWGLVVVLATVIGVLQGPKALVDLHELMCGSASWKGVAGRFGDCAAYAQKPTQVVITGAGVPSGPLPKAVVYNEQLQQFETALRDGDGAFLNHLHAAGFRLKAENVCFLLNATPSFRWKVSEARHLESVRNFSESAVKCGNLPLDAAMLKRLMERIVDGICPGTEMQKTGIELLNSWIAIAGKSPDLRQIAKEQIAIVKKSGSMSKAELIELCMRDFGSYDGRLRASRASYVFTSSCNAVLGQISTHTALPTFSMDGESEADRAKRLCMHEIKTAGLHDQAKSLLSALAGWSQ